MKTIHCLILIVALKECICSEPATKSASIIELEHAIHDLNIFPTVLIKLIGGYAHPQEWALHNKWPITQLPEGAYIAEPWTVSKDNTYGAVGMRHERSTYIKIRIFDFRKIMPGIKLLETNIRSAHAYHAHASFSTDNTLLAITEPKHHTQVWNTTTWTVINEIPHTCDQPAFLPHGTAMAVGRKNVVEFIESTTGEFTGRRTYMPEYLSIDAIETTPDETILAVAFSFPIEGSFVELLDIKTGQTIKTINIIRSLLSHPRSEKLLVSLNNKFMLLKEWAGNNDLHALDNDNRTSMRLLKVPSTSHAHWAQFLPDNESVAFIESSSKISTIKIREHAKFRKTKECLLNHPQSPEKAAIKYFTVSRCGTIIVTAGEKNIYLWKLKNKE